MPQQTKQGKKSRKHGREIKKKSRKGTPLSLYVRGKISFNQYQQLTNS